MFFNEFSIAKYKIFSIMFFYLLIWRVDTPLYIHRYLQIQKFFQNKRDSWKMLVAKRLKQSENMFLYFCEKVFVVVFFCIYIYIFISYEFYHFPHAKTKNDVFYITISPLTPHILTYFFLLLALARGSNHMGP